MASVLLIGGSGFTGSYLREHLERAGTSTVSCAGRPGFDLGDPANIRRCLEAARPDVVVNLAAISFVNDKNWRQTYEVNAFGQKNLLEALVAVDFRGRLVFASSANVYGRNADLLTEHTPPRPANHYGVTKLMAESYCDFLVNDAFSIVITRPFNCIGVGQPAHFLVPKIVRHFQNRSEFIDLGNCDIRRDFVDIRDVAEMYALAINHTRAPRLINFCSGRTASIRDIIGTLERVSGHRLEIRQDLSLVRSNDLTVQCGSRRELDALGHTLRYSLEETLTWMFRTEPNT